MPPKRLPEGRRKIKTLERVLSKAGAGSRTDARSWIAAGGVCVNGRPVLDPDYWVDLDSDKVTLNGKPLRKAAPAYLLLYKPTGYLTTWKDPQGRPTVYDLTGDAGMWLSPVGRLDLDTSGLLIMTNDNAFAEYLTNPEHAVPKTYQVKAGTLLTDDQITRLRDGVSLKDGVTRPAIVTRLRESARNTFLEITITEGRNRQVRRMLEVVDSGVRKLVRTAIGPVRIGDLPIGKWRMLTAEELKSLGWTNPSTSERPQRPRSKSREYSNRYSRKSGNETPAPRLEARSSPSDRQGKHPRPKR